MQGKWDGEVNVTLQRTYVWHNEHISDLRRLQNALLFILTQFLQEVGKLWSTDSICFSFYNFLWKHKHTMVTNKNMWESLSRLIKYSIDQLIDQ